MEINKDLAMKLWTSMYGKNEWQLDCYGTWMNKNDYGELSKKRIRPNGDGKHHNYGWEIDHIRPKSNFRDENESNIYNNFEIVHYENNREKADNYPVFSIGNKRYKVICCQNCSSNNILGYGIMDINSQERIDWKGRTGKYFIENN